VFSFWRAKAHLLSGKPPLAVEIAGGKLWLAQMAAADSRDQTGRRILLHCQQAPLPDNAKALGQWLDNATLGGLPAMLLLAEHEYMVQVAELPQVAAEEVRDAMRWRLSEIFGLADDQEVSFDYQPLPGQGFNTTPNQALVFAIDNPLLQARQNLLLASGLHLQVVDTLDMAQRNLAALLESDERGQATLSLGERGGLLTVTQHDTLFLSRRLDVSLGAWQQATAERRAGFCERIALEIQRSLDVFDRQYSAIGLSRLLVAPMPEREEFIEQLVDNLYIPVAPYPLEQAIALERIPALQDPQFQAQAWGVIGLSLRPPEERP
jgi:MSHA biogenesis protein MshI